MLKVALCALLGLSTLSVRAFRAATRPASFAPFPRAISTSLSSTTLDQTADDPFKNTRVEFVDLNAGDLLPPSPTARPLPLFCLPSAFFPEGETVLNVFEMRYRTMMFDCAEKFDDYFVHVYVHREGTIAAVGTLCKITYRQLEDDGRQIIVIRGEGRVRLRKILKTLPYVTAEVETDVHDRPPESEAEAAKLAQDAYDQLKYYMRLLKSHPPNSHMTVTKYIKAHRPLRGVDSPQQREKFSMALANLAVMVNPDYAQKMLQTDDTYKRLLVEKSILTTAADLISTQLVNLGSLTAEARDGIKMNALNDNISDADILPGDEEEEEAVEEEDEWDLQKIN